MAAITGLTLSTPRILAKASDSPKIKPINNFSFPWKKRSNTQFLRLVAAAAPEGLSEKVAESIKNAEEACAGDPVSGECAAAWDEVEELSAAVSHLKEKNKDSDPLENYCKDNPETNECRTYDN
ncbi:Calvin cycle protein CP12-2 [Forsythia ovata]|uniref:Calvin cycle protein CP12-2 n=1 Tax=Forsythia ovata TaxID=205694 RepID=A0ABD1T4V9_9LAMI